ncbi:MAG TPA: hypothetical protein VKH83_11720 [Methylomirabilota bacterium]|nr:hypothetical protein [Methylomirabilota bacterium]
MMGRATIVLGTLLIAGSFAATKDLGYDDAAVTRQVVSADGAASDSWWRQDAVTVRPDQIFEN